MEKNLFQQAKDLMDGFISQGPEHEHHAHREQDREVVRRAIQAAYNDATPEEEQQLRDFEKQLDEKMQLD